MVSPEQESWQLPSSTSIAVRHTAEAGRAVFANKTLRNRDHVLTTTQELSPLAHVLLRPYRKEVCAYCFGYDRGREWKIRDMSTATAFCSTECYDKWRLENDETCLAAMRMIESFIKTCSHRQTRALESDQLLVPFLTKSNIATREGIADIWDEIGRWGDRVVEARACEKPTKAQRSVLIKVATLTPDPDILTYILSGIVTAHRARGAVIDNAEIQSAPLRACYYLPALFALAADDQVFFANPMTPSPVYDYASAYLVLLSLLPECMLVFASTHLVINLASRASHNAFSIRPEGTSDGDQSGEFLGWGVWPEASFFNHSCHPNVRKERRGRIWSFYVDLNEDNPVDKHEQLCITYLGGDEKDLNVQERRKRLQDQWGFYCGCKRCLHESRLTTEG